MTTLHVRVRVAGEAYALPVEDVLEIADLGDVVPVPGAPPAILGVRNLRGQILPILDLAGVLGLSAAEPAKRVVIAEDGSRRAGLAVDSVDDVAPLESPAEGAESPYLAGAGLDDGALVGYVDVASVLASVGATPRP
jgi:purine-binding chemotaxis protein CheW